MQGSRRVLALFSALFVLASLLIVPGLAAAAAPQSCAEVRQQNPAATDGEYTLALQGHVAHIYCADMAGTPTEYITLAHTGGSYNYSLFYGNHKNHYYQYWWVYGTNAVTNYNKVRIDPVSLVVDQNDQRFAVITSEGKNGFDSSDPNFNPVPKTVAYATAADCASSWSAQGKANVDLTGTDFALDDGVSFAWGGFAANGSVSVSPDRQVVNLTGGGWCGGAGPQGPLKLKLLTPLADQDPPVTTASAPAGWQNHNVTVTLSATDDASGVAATYWQLDGAPAHQGTSVVVSTDGSHTLAYWSVDNQGNVEAQQTVTVEVDKTPPTISGSASTTGWTNQPVTVTFTCADATSGVQSCQEPATLTGEGANQSAAGTAADNAGNTASATVSGINIDLTAPAVTYQGNAGTYTVDQQVKITCSATDALSGVAASTCQTVAGPAYTYALGDNSFSASATDKAGNEGSGSTAFTVAVSYDSLCKLTRQFVKQDGLAKSFCAKLDAAKASAARGDDNSKAGQIDAFVNQLQAQSGKVLTAEQAAILTQLAQAL
jgi:hypothetical protein